MTHQRFVLFCVLAGLTVGSIGACESPESQSDTREQSSAVQASSPAPDTMSDTTSARTYTATGTVRSITPSGSHVVIDHEQIPGFMDAMTMPFRVSDTVSVDHLDREHRVVFRFSAGDDGATIRSIEVIEDS